MELLPLKWHHEERYLCHSSRKSIALSRTRWQYGAFGVNGTVRPTRARVSAQAAWSLLTSVPGRDPLATASVVSNET